MASRYDTGHGRAPPVDFVSAPGPLCMAAATAVDPLHTSTRNAS